MYVITGATGNTGSIIATTLLDAGKQVRIIARDAVEAPVTIFRVYCS